MSNGDPLLELELTPRLDPPIAGRLAPTPYSFELTASEALRLTVHNSQIGTVVAVHVRKLDRQAGIVTNVYHYAPRADRAPDWEDWFIGEGYLLNATAFASSGAPQRGQTFVRLQIVRGAGAARTVLGTLLQGYVTENQDLAWPGSPLQGPLEGDGVYRSITGSDVTPGVELVETVPTGARWQLLMFYYQLTTSAVAANRRSSLVIDAGVITIYHALQQYQQTASLTGEYTWTPGGQVENPPPVQVSIGYLPTPTILLAGHRVRTVTYNMQGFDDYAPPQYTIREWLEAQ